MQWPAGTCVSTTQAVQVHAEERADLVELLVEEANVGHGTNQMRAANTSLFSSAQHSAHHVHRLLHEQRLLQPRSAYCVRADDIRSF